jgi:predicted dinucleotide-binding enzyme
MRIGVLGSGEVGRVLGAGFAALGHEVKMGSREPGSEKLRTWLAKAGPKASTGTPAEAAAFSETAVLATDWSGTKSAIDLAGPANLAGKVVIDVTNPLIYGKPGEAPTLALGHRDSGGEQVQRWLPDASVVKCFNIVGNPHMVEPDFPGGPPDMFLCGNDEAARKTVAGLAAAFGWPVIDLGGIENARYLEPFAMVWIVYGFRTMTWNHAFRLLRK